MRDFYTMTLIKKIKKVNLTLLAITQLLGGLTFSLLSPFYTEEATQKGIIHTFERKAETVGNNYNRCWPEDERALASK